MELNYSWGCERILHQRRNHIQMTAYCIVGKVTPLYAVIRPSWLYPITLHIQAKANCIRRTSFTTSKQMSVSIAALFFTPRALRS